MTEQPNQSTKSKLMHHHGKIERNATLLMVLALVVVAVGGIVEIAPLFYLQNTIEKVTGMRPYSPLELIGRHIYIREGCYVCHSQMIRPMRDEVERYGMYSLAAESMYDHPFQWGSKRTGPDLLRVGGKYPHLWHFRHMEQPTSTTPGSLMPRYGHRPQKHWATLVTPMPTLPYSSWRLTTTCGPARWRSRRLASCKTKQPSTKSSQP